MIICSPLLAQKGFSINAGITMAKMHAKVQGTNINSDSKTGITVGVAMDVPISKTFGFQPALHFVQKGYKVTDVDYTDKLTINYLEVPLDLVFRPTMPQVQFFVGAGPSFSFAFSGKEKEDDAGSSSTYDYKFGNNPDEHDMRGFDYGVNFLTGVELKCGFLFAASYNIGLRNLVPGGSSDGSVKNSNIGLRVGYKFGGKK
jgi:hypothetical protein